MLNNKGFVLVETLIVTVFVVAMFVFAYRNTVPMMGEYEKMSSFDDVDSVYAINLYKQLVLRYANMDYIDNYLNTNNYLDIGNCSDTNIYISSDYCKKLQRSLDISDNDSIFITRYNVSLFRNEVKNDEKFDSGTLSNFRNYMNTVADEETFYTSSGDNEIVNGLYRIFITRTVENADKTKTSKYANIGIYSGKYKRYNAGDEITFNPGTGSDKFYVLKNSATTENTVTLIAANNLNPIINYNNSNFNSEGPTNVLNTLKVNTDSWTNVNTFTAKDGLISDDGYTISYNGYRARLLDDTDIREALGCSSEDLSCFDPANAFSVSFDKDKFSFLVNNLGATNGYWTANTVTNSGGYAWVIKNGSVSSEVISSYYGLRPVIVVDKNKL